MARRALKPFSGKSLEEMSHEELERFIIEGGGLPAPAHSASYEESMQWYVATIFLFHLQDREDTETAKIEAANCVLGDSDYMKKLPYLEQALGRQLKPNELASRHIISVADLF